MTTRNQSGIQLQRAPGPAVARVPERSGPIAGIQRAFPALSLAAIVATLVGFGRYGPDLGVAPLDTYRALLFVHITAAVVALGSTFALPVLQPIGARGGIPSLRLVLRFAEQLEKRVVTPGSMLVIGSGVGLILTDATGYRAHLPGWLVIAIAWVAFATIVATTVQGPGLRRALAILDGVPDEGSAPPELGPVAARMKLTGRLLSLSTIGILFLMAWKPDI